MKVADRLVGARSSAPTRSTPGNEPPAVKIVLSVYVGGAPQYWGIEMTSMKNPPILEGETGSYDSGGPRVPHLLRRQEPPAPRLPEGRRDLLDLQHARQRAQRQDDRGDRQVAPSAEPRRSCPRAAPTRRSRSRPRGRPPERAGAGRQRSPAASAIGVIGAGYVGLVTGVCLASHGLPGHPPRHRRRRRSRRSATARCRSTSPASPSSWPQHAERLTYTLSLERMLDALGHRLRRRRHAADLLGRRRPLARDGRGRRAPDGRRRLAPRAGHEEHRAGRHRRARARRARRARPRARSATAPTPSS